MFDSTATLKRPTIGRDLAQGATQDPFKVLWTNRWCSYQEKGPRVETIYAQRSTQVHSTVYFAQDPVAEANDRLEVTVFNQDGSTTLVLLNVVGEAQMVSRAVVWELEVERIRAPQ